MTEAATQAVLKQIHGKSPSLLYRQLLKLYIKKFDTDHNTIIKAWKQTKYEFWLNRRANAADVEALMFRGQTIYNTILACVVPIYTDPKTGKSFARYDRETMKANDSNIDPIPVDEWVRRYHDRIPKEELKDIQLKLINAGRWTGSTELSEETLARKRFKTKRQKTKCTDPDPPEEGDTGAEVESVSASGETLPSAGSPSSSAQTSKREPLDEAAAAAATSAAKASARPE